MARLEDHLVLNRYIHTLFGADAFEDLKSLLRLVDEGPAEDGQSYFFGRLLTQPGLQIDRERLAIYDRRVIELGSRLREKREDFKGFRYFQYLALLYTEVFLDRLTSDPGTLANELNSYLVDLKASEHGLEDFPEFKVEDLARLAFFMATGSGKTLLMHSNVLQILHYLKIGRHTTALVRRDDGHRLFDNIILITPNEGLSNQHIDELQASGIDAGLFIEDPYGRAGLFGPKVKVIEIHKLADEPSRDGVSIVLEEIGKRNLVLVDEGHKGAGSEAQTWKRRQKYLSEEGFLVEYSATFAQAIGGASGRTRTELLQEYGKAIIFDYSYAHFYSDGYGKDFNVLNLAKGHAEQAHELLVGGLLTYFNQFHLYQSNKGDFRSYNLERPLWVLLGSSVNALYTRNKRRRSDVAEAVAFIKRFLEQRDWSEKIIDRTLRGDSGYVDAESGLDLFSPHLNSIRDLSAQDVYKLILRDLFHGTGGLEVWEIKRAEGELGLRVSTAHGEKSPYFGVINIGDVSAFRRYLGRNVGLDVQEDRFSPSLFNQVNNRGSSINLLVGAKKFIEGWSSWRVASMGLLNIGRGEGPQIIQLFGRGVRLKGRAMSLKRSRALPEENGHPSGIRSLETLYIFGWNADYIETFKEMLEREDVGTELTLPVELMAPWPRERLPIPQKAKGFDADTLTWLLSTEGPQVALDLAPKLASLASHEQAARIGSGHLMGTVSVGFSDDHHLGSINLDELYRDALAHKQLRGYRNLVVLPQKLSEILEMRCSVTMLETDASMPQRVQDAASRVLRSYMDRFVRQMEREAESQHVDPGYLDPDGRILREYRIRVKSGSLLDRIADLLESGVAQVDAGEPLPRFHLDQSLFNPLLAEGGEDWKKEVSVRPPALVRAERDLVRDLKHFWQANHNVGSYNRYNLYLLRNLPRAGIGLFHRSGFFPDFIMWIFNEDAESTHVRFLDPHGLHHGGLAGSADKFAALNALRDFSSQKDFEAKKITLDGFLLVSTPLHQIPDSQGMTWTQLENEYPLIRQEGDYISRILVPPTNP